MTDQDAEGALQAQIDEAKASGDIAKASELYRQQIGNVDPYGDEAAARFRRVERNARKEFGQRFFWRPGASAPRRAPDLGAATGG